MNDQPNDQPIQTQTDNEAPATIDSIIPAGAIDTPKLPHWVGD